MGNLIKYNLKSYYKEMLILLSLIVLCNLGLFYKINKWPKEAFIALSFVILTFSCFVVLIWNISMFSKDLYSDTSYLIFTLPVKGRSILGAKLITAVVQMIIVNIVAGIFVYIHFKGVPSIYENFSNYLNFKFMSMVFVVAIIEYLNTLLIIYVSIALSRVTIKKRKLGTLGSFGIFIVICMVIEKMSFWLQKVFPQTMQLSIIPNSVMEKTTSGINLYFKYVNVNIATTIFDVVITVALFFIASYLLQEKVEI